MPSISKKKIVAAPSGWKIIFSSLFLTLAIWLATLKSYDFIIRDPFLFFSKIAALTGTICMCWAIIFSTRFQLFERLFHGLDKAYHAHRKVATWSFILISLHPLFQFFRFIPNWREAVGLFIPLSFGAVDWGLLSFGAFALLFALTLWIPIPYHIWKKTHEWFGAVLILALLHVVFIDRQVNESILLSIWIYGFFTVASASFIYIRFFYLRFGPRYRYRVARIEKIRTTWNVYLEPTSEKVLKYKPAQFLYISFHNKEIGREIHPFSVSSSPEHPLRLTIKNLGDYTSRLDLLKSGDQATIWGPYGRLYENYLLRKEKDAVFIAGGIGITPFLSLLAYEADNPNPRKTDVFYCVKNRERADFHEEILSYTKKNPSIRYHLFLSKEELLNIAKIQIQTGETVKNKSFFICGPLKMMKFFENRLKKAKIKNRDIVFEDFNLLD